EVFALVLAAAAMALFVGVALAERRLELATMAALGASLRGVAAFVWSEAALVLAGALALAALLGWLLAEMLVAMLRHVFDPPPDHLAAPWAFLAGLGGAVVLGAVLTAALASPGSPAARLAATTTSRSRSRSRRSSRGCRRSSAAAAWTAPSSARACGSTRSRTRWPPTATRRR